MIVYHSDFRQSEKELESLVQNLSIERPLVVIMAIQSLAPIKPRMANTWPRSGREKPRAHLAPRTIDLRG